LVDVDVEDDIKGADDVDGDVEGADENTGNVIFLRLPGSSTIIISVHTPDDISLPSILNLLAPREKPLASGPSSR